MNISRAVKQTYLTGLVLAISMNSWGAARFDISARPLGSVAPLVLSGTDLSVGGVTAYQPWFENGSWQGDIVEYSVSTGGALTTSVEFVGSSPSNPGTLPANWSALVAFANAAADDADYWTGDRKIITKVGTQQVAFTFYSGTIGTDNMISLDPTSVAADTTSNVLDFIRGDRSNENPVGDALRSRASILGSIIHSNPVYVGAPNGGRSENDYALWASGNGRVNREHRVYAGANDGMLHVFDAEDGSEVYAYIPSMLIAELPKLTARPYIHTYFVDGPLTVRDAYFPIPGSTSKWRTVLVGTTGAGGSGIFALDITNPDLTDQGSSSPDDAKILWELHAGDGSTYAADLGDAMSRGVIAKLNDNKWYVLIGNGYNSVNGKAKLLIIDIGTGVIVEAIATDAMAADTGNPNGLSSPSLIDSDRDGKVDFAYAGDINGNLWKFDLEGSTPDSWEVAYGGVPLHAGLISAGGEPTQPITVSPTVVRHPDNGYIVHFATGRYFTADDKANTDTQSIYGIWDRGNASLPTSPTLLDQILVTPLTYTYSRVDGGGDTISGEETIGIYNPKVDIIWADRDGQGDADEDDGWRVDLPSGFRVLEPIQVRAARVKATITNPDTEENWLVEASIYHGGEHDTPVFDLDRDRLLKENDDLYAILGEDPEVWRVPMALKEPDGIMSRVTIARITNGKDTQFRNLLTPPVIEDECVENCSFQGGHIDVDTWVDSIPLGEGSSQHDHEYDKKVNQVTVDFFNLNIAAPTPPLSDKNKDVVDQIEINADGDPRTPSSTIASDEEFLVLMINADFSPGSKFTLGTKEWHVVEYQRQIHMALREWDPADGTAALVDTDGDPLVFTWGGIELAGGTIKHSFNDATIINGGLHPTQTGCVRDNAYGGKDNVTYNPANQEGRWRNGALTTQLVKASFFSSNPAIWDVIQQNPDDLKPEFPVSGYVSTCPGDSALHVDNVIKTSCDWNPDGILDSDEHISGLLAASGTEHIWESTLFWHFGNLAKVVIGKKPCYGDPEWEEAVTLEQHNTPIANALEQILDDYDGVLPDSFDEDLDLEDLIDAIEADCSAKNSDCKNLYKLLEKLAKLLDDYQDNPGDGGGDGPVGGDDGEEDSTAPETYNDLEDEEIFGGPNFDYGRMTWTDLVK
ncbi:MAG: hypothetical protein ACI9JM_000801 [Halioglobus sp.]|jgi:hypothetical protein